MAANDIRRQTGDVQPTNFVRPGVENRGIAQAIEAVTSGAIAVDAAVQTKDLAAQLDEARSAFIVGSPVTQAEDQLSDGDLQAQLDKQLAPVRAVLASRKRAVDQGSITSDRFNLEADALLQRAIAKRPGLAPELRQLHAEYTGGFLLDELTRREAEMLQDHLRERETAQKTSEDKMKWQAERLKETGYGAEAGMVYGDPEAMDQLFQSRYQDVARFGQRNAEAQYWQDVTTSQDSIDKMQKPAAVQAWTSFFNKTWEDIGASVNVASSALAGADEDTFAVMATEFNTALLKAKAQLQSQRATLKLSPEEIAPQMALMDDLQTKANALLDGSVSLDQRKKKAEVWKLTLQAQLRQDAPLIATIAGLEQIGGPETVKQVMADSAVLNQQQSQELHNFVVDRGNYRPETINSIAAGQAAALLKDVFPEGTQTDTPVQPGSVKLLAKQGVAFAITPADKFKTNLFNDWVREVSFYGEALSEKLPDDLRMELANSVAMGAYKNVRTRILQLYQDVPSLANKLRGNADDFASDDVIVPRAGVALAPAEQQAVDVANSQLNYGASLKLVSQLYKAPTMAAAGQQIWTSAELVQGASNLHTVQERDQKAQEARGAAGTGGSGGGGGAGRHGPVPGAIEDGYRFNGGDPGDPANWEKVSG